MSQVQIPEELFRELWAAFCYPECQEWTDEEIATALREKMNRYLDRLFFTRYKRAPAGSAEREQWRKAYLDRRGVLPDWRTEKENQL